MVVCSCGTQFDGLVSENSGLSGTSTDVSFCCQVLQGSLATRFKFRSCPMYLFHSRTGQPLGLKSCSRAKHK